METLLYIIGIVLIGFGICGGIFSGSDSMILIGAVAGIFAGSIFIALAKIIENQKRIIGLLERQEEDIRKPTDEGKENREADQDNE